MKINTHSARDEQVGDLVDDARALLDATANITDHKVARARKRLHAALQRGHDTGNDLVDAVTDSTEENIRELCNRISAALEQGKELYDEVHDDVVGRAKAADHTVRENPYKVLGIALGVGAVVGLLLSNRSNHNGK